MDNCRDVEANDRIQKLNQEKQGCLLCRISLNVFTSTGINCDQKYSNSLKNCTESWVTEF